MHAHRGGDGRAPTRAAGGILIGHRGTGPAEGGGDAAGRMGRGAAACRDGDVGRGAATCRGAARTAAGGSAQPHQVRRAAQGLGLPERGRYAVVVLGTAAMVPDGDRDGARWCWCGEVGVVLLGREGLDGPAGALGEAGAGPGGVSPVVGGLAELGLARRLAGRRC
ncbi:hypothetical protein ACN24M_07020 [Streptomyces microflavus]